MEESKHRGYLRGCILSNCFHLCLETFQPRRSGSVLQSPINQFCRCLCELIWKQTQSFGKWVFSKLLYSKRKLPWETTTYPHPHSPSCFFTKMVNLICIYFITLPQKYFLVYIKAATLIILWTVIRQYAIKTS